MKKILLLLILVSSVSFGQTTIANKLKVTAATKNNTATRVVVQDSITKEYHWILKSTQNTNLDKIVSPTGITVLSSTGNDVVLPLVTNVYSGLMKPEDKVILDSLATVTPVDISGKENISNKATDFSTVNNTLYPSVQAVKTQMDLKAPVSGSVNYIQNQNSSAQSANLWINGSGIFNGNIFGSNKITVSSNDQSFSRLQINNTGSTGNRTFNLIAGIANVGQEGFSIYDNVADATRLMISNDGGIFINSITDNGSGAKLQVTGASTFSSDITVNGTLGLRNVANTFTSYFINFNTASRTYTLQNRNGTLADDTDLALKANLASPTFTGAPTAPTATAGTNTTQIATTAFVQESRILPVTETGTSFSLTDAYNGKVVVLTASCTVTIPNGLIAGFECSFVTLAGVTQTIALGGSVVLFNNAGTTMAEKLSFTLKNRTATNNYITVGSL